MAKLEVRPGSSARNSPALQPLPSLGVGKGPHSAPNSPETLILPIISPSPPQSANQMQNRPWSAVYKSALADNNPYVIYSTPKCGASIDLWKKVAKKAEFELHLERNSHRADSSKDHNIIQRLHRRMFPMEKALGKSKATIKQQAKLIEDLKSKMLSAAERTEAELSYLRLQSQNMQRYLTVAAGNNTRKITELEEELHQANSTAEALKDQMDHIYRTLNDLPEVVNMDCIGESGQCASRLPDRGLVVLAKVKVICDTNEDLRKQLRDKDETLAAVAQENERLRKTAEEAACRSNKLVNIAESLRQERDMALNKLKDLVESIRDLEDFARSYTSSVACEPTSLARNPESIYLQKPMPPHTLQSASTVVRAVHWTEEKLKHPASTDKDTVLPFPAEAEEAKGLSAMMVGPGESVVYCKTMSGEEPPGLEVSLVDKLHAAFWVLLCKMESANQTAASLKRENEGFRSTLQEVYQELKGEKITRCMTSDDYNVALRVAVSELGNSSQGLRKENALLQTVKLQQEKKITDLESQTHTLTLDKKALFETIEVVKNVMRASNGGQESGSHVEGFSNRIIVKGKNLIEFPDVVEKSTQDTRSTWRLSTEEVKDEEILRLRKLYDQSLDESKQLKAERDSLDNQLQDLKQDCESFHQERKLFVKSQSRFKFLQKEKEVLETDLHELQKDYQNLKAGTTLKEDSLKACRSDPVEQQVPNSNKDTGRSGWLEFLKALKCRMDASSLGRNLVTNLSMTSDEEEEFSGVEKMARQLLEEANESRFAVKTLKEQMEVKEKEVSELRELYSESKSLSIKLQINIDALEFAMQDLHKSVQFIKKVLDEGMDISDPEEVSKGKIFWKSEGLFHEKVVHEVASIQQRLNTAEKSLNEIEEVLGVKVLSCTDLESKAANIRIPVKSLQEDRDIGSTAPGGSIEISSFTKRHLKCMANLLAGNDLNLLHAAERDSNYTRTSSRGEEGNVMEVLGSSDDLMEMVAALPSLLQEIRELKKENETMLAELQALELENLAITGRSKEDQEKLHNLRKSAEKDIRYLKQQLAAVETIVASVSSNLSDYRETSLGDNSHENRGVQIAQLSLVERLVAVRDELCLLRREKSDADVKTGELQSRLESEQGKGRNLARMLSVNEAHVQTLSNRAIAAEEARETLTSQIEALRKELLDSNAELGELRKRLREQEELLAMEKSIWTTMLEAKQTEIVRFGRFNVVDPGAKKRRAAAAEEMKQYLARNSPLHSLLQPSAAYSSTSPLLFLTTFTVDLLVNGKIFNQLVVGGPTGGLCHGVIHYFSINGETGDLTFENPLVPGSTSSNMVADVFFVPRSDDKPYRTRPGDILGLQIKVSSVEDRNPREALYNHSIVHTNQVLDAIKGQAVDAFTLWPDLISCWRWERRKEGENSWNLVGVRWRFLMKNIFPDLIESLQTLDILTSATRPAVSTIVAK